MALLTFNTWAVTDSPPVGRVGPHSDTQDGRRRFFANTDVADVLAYVMWQWHTRIEPVTQFGGWRSRELNSSVGANPASNHRSATAVDINFDDHPYEKTLLKKGKTYTLSFQPRELATLRAIASECRDDSGRTVVRLGIDFEIGLRDDMHVEIAPGASRTRVQQAARRIRSVFRPPATMKQVEAYQRILGVKEDGVHGEDTVAALRERQRRLRLFESGLWDRATRAALTGAPPVTIIPLMTTSSGNGTRAGSGPSSTKETAMTQAFADKPDLKGAASEKFGPGGHSRDALLGYAALGGLGVLNELPQMRGTIAGLTAAVRQLARGQGINPKLIEEAARRGVKRGMAELVKEGE